MKLFLDTDLNFPSDDYQALMLLLATQGVELVGIGAAAGNTWAEEVEVNVFEALHALGVDPSSVPVFSGPPAGDFAADREVMLHDAPRRFIGAHGKAATPRPWTLRHDAAWARRDGVGDAADAIIELSLRHEGDLVVVCLGPLTNLARALERDPAVGHRLKDVFAMGGHFSYSEADESKIDFNFMFDPRAANVVLETDVEVRLVPLDTCRRAGITEHLLGRCALYENGWAGLFNDDFLALIRQHGPSMALADQLVALLCGAPDLVVDEVRCRVRVDCSDTSNRGLTSMTPDPAGRVRLVRQVDVGRTHDRLVSLVRDMGRRGRRPARLFATPAYRYFLGLRLADGPFTAIESLPDGGCYPREISDASDLGEFVAPFAETMLAAKAGGGGWPPTSPTDATAALTSPAPATSADQLACLRAERTMFELLTSARAVAVTAPDGASSGGLSCLFQPSVARRQLLRRRFGGSFPEQSVVAEFGHFTSRLNGGWDAEFPDASLYRWYSTARQDAIPQETRIVTWTSRAEPQRDLSSLGYELLAEHVVEDGPEAGRLLLLHRLTGSPPGG